LAIVGMSGLIVRVVFALLVRGYRYPDIALMTDIIGLANPSLIYGGVYNATPFTVSPIMGYVMSLMGRFASIFGIENDTVGMQFLIKIPFILADIGIFILLFFIASRYLNKIVSIVLASLVYLNPAVIWNSSISGQVNSLMVILILGALYMMLKRKLLPMLILYGLAVLTDGFALWFFPPLVLLSAFYFVRAIKHIRGQKYKVFDKRIWTDIDARPVITVLPYIILTLLGMYLITLPKMRGLESRSIITFFNYFIIRQFGNADIFGNNALSIYNIFLRNQVEINFPIAVFATAFVALIFGLVAYIYFNKRNRVNLLLVSIYAAMTVALYFVGFRESTLIVLLPLLILAYIVIGDKRIMHVFALLSTVVLVNSAAVMISGDWLNNASWLELSNAGVTVYSHHLTSGMGRVVSITCSILAVIIHVYFTYILFDIAIRNKRVKNKEFESTPSFGEAVADWISFKKESKEIDIISPQ